MNLSMPNSRPIRRNYLGSYLWASVPSASSVPIGSEIYVSDIGQRGVFLMSTGTYWRPLNGVYVQLTQLADITTAANTNEQIFTAFQTTFPGSFLQPGCHIELMLSLSKSSTVDTSALKFRLGTAGTTSDTQIGMTTNFATTSISAGFLFDFNIKSATTVMKTGNASTTSPYGGTSTGAGPTANTISNISNALILSLSSTMTTGVETVTLHDSIIKVSFP